MLSEIRAFGSRVRHAMGVIIRFWYWFMESVGTF